MSKNPTARIQVRINPAVKKRASELLEDMGLDLSTGINMFLKQIVNTQSFPFQPTAQQYDSLAKEALREPGIEFENIEQAHEFMKKCLEE